MSEGHHDLANILPEHREAIRSLKAESAHFARLVSEYHELAKELHQIEAEIETPSDEYVETLKKRRLAALDAIVEQLNAA